MKQLSLNASRYTKTRKFQQESVNFMTKQEDNTCHVILSIKDSSDLIYRVFYQ